ncbi:hypothetical protein Micbo1qcDRAFT_71510 [Microdochium bolleyi]|uniref:Uncharacterized protein n=1 Tax=Microdochium bolleyi TaxID=196109 RepID=A0A136J0N4_9PEZI|nr:hypothetical protein Micbo1qcDRAFT_71510 [Microdochium bolleyi]
MAQWLWAKARRIECFERLDSETLLTIKSGVVVECAIACMNFGDTQLTVSQPPQQGPRRVSSCERLRKQLVTMEVCLYNLTRLLATCSQAVEHPPRLSTSAVLQRPCTIGRSGRCSLTDCTLRLPYIRVPAFFAWLTGAGTARLLVGLVKDDK